MTPLVPLVSPLLPPPLYLPVNTVEPFTMVARTLIHNSDPSQPRLQYAVQLDPETANVGGIFLSLADLQQPATYPAVRELRLVSEGYPWTIVISAVDFARSRFVGPDPNVVTVGMILAAIANNVFEHVTQPELAIASDADRFEMDQRRRRRESTLR